MSLMQVGSTIGEASVTLEVRYLYWLFSAEFCVLAKISKLLINKTALLIRKLRNSVVK